MYIRSKFKVAKDKLSFEDERSGKCTGIAVVHFRSGWLPKTSNIDANNFKNGKIRFNYCFFLWVTLSSVCLKVFF